MRKNSCDAVAGWLQIRLVPVVCRRVERLVQVCKSAEISTSYSRSAVVGQARRINPFVRVTEVSRNETNGLSKTIQNGRWSEAALSSSRCNGGGTGLSTSVRKTWLV